MRMLGCVLILILTQAFAQAADARYRQLVRVIDRNTGFAHMTRGVNMFTLYALRSCVNAGDIPVLSRMLTDRDRIVRRAVASVLVDLGKEGSGVVRRRLQETAAAADRSILEDALADEGHVPAILSYPLTGADRKRIHGCPP